jgi:hypothetical protein
MLRRHRPSEQTAVDKPAHGTLASLAGLFALPVPDMRRRNSLVAAAGCVFALRQRSSSPASLLP